MSWYSNSPTWKWTRAMEKVTDIFQAEIYASDAYKNMHTRTMDFPIIVDVEPTNACNLNCLFCARQTMTRPVRTMGLETLKVVVDEMKQHRHTSIRFSGWGEPTLNPQIVDFVKYCRANNVLTHLTTNATLLTAELATGLLQAGLNKIKFSMQGLTTEEYNRMRPSRAQDDPRCGYERITANIEQFIELRNSLAIPCHIQVSVSMLKGEQENMELQQMFYDRWYPQVDSIWGLGKVGVYGGRPLLTSFQRVKASGRICVEDLSQGRPLRQDDVNHSKRCTELYNKISISAEGVLKACCDDYDNQLVLGQVGQDSIASVWGGARLSALRKNIASGDSARVPKFCRSCDNYL